MGTLVLAPAKVINLKIFQRSAFAVVLRGNTMSKIYVKWNELNRASDNYRSCAAELQKCSSRVENVRDNLRLSSDVSAQIKLRLGKESEQLMRMSKSLNNASQTLSDLSTMYRDTERGMIDK